MIKIASESDLDRRQIQVGDHIMYVMRDDHIEIGIITDIGDDRVYVNYTPSEMYPYKSNVYHLFRNTAKSLSRDMMFHYQRMSVNTFAKSFII